MMRILKVVKAAFKVLGFLVLVYVFVYALMFTKASMPSVLDLYFDKDLAPTKHAHHFTSSRTFTTSISTTTTTTSSSTTSPSTRRPPLVALNATVRRRKNEPVKIPPEAMDFYAKLKPRLSDPYMYIKDNWKPDPADLIPQHVSNEVVIQWAPGSNDSRQGYAGLLPGEDLYDDRILRQLDYIPKGYSQQSPMKYIYGYPGIESVPGGQDKFLKDQCKVNRCSVTNDVDKADAVLFTHFPNVQKKPGQIWVWFALESPLHTALGGNPQGLINWTATYRLDSVIVAPYYKFVYNNNGVPVRPLKDYSEGKSKNVAWFVSNCETSTGRLNFARELSKHIDVDIYGACGDKQCPRTSQSCFDMLSDEYKFYLAFENSLCRHYITEKFFSNGLEHDIIPIARGARKSEYIASSPHNSFIFADDFKSPADLAHYLKSMDKNQYNSYFAWRQQSEMLNTKFWCRMCTMLHASSELDAPKVWINDVDKWWRGDGVCDRR